MIGSSLFALDELEKSENGRLSIPKTYNIELKIETLYVSLEIASSVSDRGLHSSFLFAFA